MYSLIVLIVCVCPVGTTTTLTLPITSSTHPTSTFAESELLTIESCSAEFFSKKYLGRPEMWDLIKIVIPNIKAEWKSVAYSMRYDPQAVKAIEVESHDLEEHCQKLFEDWLTTSHGPTPKTWQTLLEKISDVENLTIAIEKIEEMLIKRFT